MAGPVLKSRRGSWRGCGRPRRESFPFRRAVLLSFPFFKGLGEYFLSRCNSLKFWEKAISENLIILKTTKSGSPKDIFKR